MLAAAAVVLAAGAAGTSVAWRRGAETAVGHPAAPAELLAAVQAEQVLLADLRASADTTGHLAPVIADHTAHLAALRSAVAAYPTSRPPEPARPGSVRSAAYLAAAEGSAAKVAAQRAAALDGSAAVLLATVAASEASHASLLT
jgi:hypothetical protein